MKITTEESIRKARVELEKKLRKQTEKLSSLKEQLLHEVNERKLIEHTLKESEARLKQVQRIALLGSWEWDITQNKTTWSEELYRIFNVNPEEFDPNAYETFLNCIYPDDKELVEKTIEKA